MKYITELLKKERKLIKANNHRTLSGLHNFIDEDLLNFCLTGIKRNTPVSTSGRSLKSMNKDISIPYLLKELNEGLYHPVAVKMKQVTVKNKLRDVGKLPLEDELLQKAVKVILEPVYEQVFFNFNTGYRRGKWQVDAHSWLRHHITYGGYRYLIKADLHDFFSSIDHEYMMEFLKKRISDDVILHLVEEWLATGNVNRNKPEERPQGLPTGSPLAPMLSNIYLHYTLDNWFVSQIQPLMLNTSFMVRFCDDFIMGFNNANDARRVYRTLFKRLAKYHLYLNQRKTCMVKLEVLDDKHGSSKCGSVGNSTDADGFKHHTFEFLKHHCWLGKTKKGEEVLRFKLVE
ncbi:hypothetical protein EYV94_25085 [Puteibacter caeruleilacunae]|nr:hypothetical protein EYV94_25085 [Puteibacter caeruleilacunae]